MNVTCSLPFDLGLQKVLSHAERLAGEKGAHYAGADYLLLGLLSFEDMFTGTVFRQLNVDPLELYTDLRAQLPPTGDGLNQKVEFTPRANVIIALASDEAVRFNAECVSSVHLLIGLLREGNGPTIRSLHERGVTLNKVREMVRELELLFLGRD